MNLLIGDLNSPPAFIRVQETLSGSVNCNETFIASGAPTITHPPAPSLSVERGCLEDGGESDFHPMLSWRNAGGDRFYVARNYLPNFFPIPSITLSARIWTNNFTLPAI